VIGGRNPEQANKVATLLDCNPAAIMSADNAYFTLSGNVTMQCGGKVLELKSVQGRGLERRSTGGQVPPPKDLVAIGRSALGLTTKGLHGVVSTGMAFDSSFLRAPPGAIEREEDLQGAPSIPFKPFSAAYLAKALATPTNWTALGAVTAVKNQGPHGYCGTFGRVGSAEGQFAMKTSRLVSFSEEELIDCVGWDKDQYSYFSTKGFMTTADYPYNLSNYPDQDPPIPGNPCRYNASAVVSGTPGFFNASTGKAPNEAQMAAFIYRNGPVSASINANVFGLRTEGCEATSDCFITEAMCNDPKINGKPIDHSIVVVGYGTHEQHGDFWIIKNSWSTRFANRGYINVARGVGCAGMCGSAGICGNVFATGDPAAYYE